VNWLRTSSRSSMWLRTRRESIRAGHERVLRAASPMRNFSGRRIRKCRLADYLPKLERVPIDRGSGAYRDKVEAHPRHRPLFHRAVVQPRHAHAHVAEADRAANSPSGPRTPRWFAKLHRLRVSLAVLYRARSGRFRRNRRRVYDHYRPLGLEIPSRQSTGAPSLSGKTRFRRWVFCRGVVPRARAIPTHCVAPTGNRQDHSGEEAARFGSPGRRRRARRYLTHKPSAA